MNVNFIATLEKYVASSDFKAGVMASTDAAWTGGSYSVELLPDGSWKNIPSDAASASMGKVLRIQSLWFSEGADLNNIFILEKDEIAQMLRDGLM